MKKIVILTGSARKGGNSDLMADAFVKGALEAGHEIVKFETARKKISGCIACNTCFSKGVACTLMDDFNEIAPSIESADIIVFCTPLYWYTFPAQIKAAIDKIYSFLIGGRPLKIVESAILVCAETDNEKDFDGILRTYELILEYTQWKDRGRVIVPSVNKIGDIKQTDALEKAEKLGISI